MDKEELLKMAREAGCPTWFGVAPMEFVENFANAILERAAQECDKIEGMYWHGDGAKAATDCAEAIRVMKGE